MATKYSKELDDLKITYSNFPIISDFSRKSFKMTHQIAEVLGKELKLLESLECTHVTSAFVCIHNSNNRIFNVLIFGAEDTPYENAGFIFQVYLPDNYPNSPPEMFLTTKTLTKNKLFKLQNYKMYDDIHPNIYGYTGKVALSLLNTTYGTANSYEKWNSEDSSLYQLITSIQFFVLNDKPYLEEPSARYQESMGKKLDKECDEYNKKIRILSIEYGMIQLLKNIPPEFEEQVKTHFKLKKNKIMDMLEIYDLNKYKEALTELIDKIDI